MEVSLMKRKYDYIIVGGGSAGAILGDRLSADGKHSVLILEAGRSDYPWDLFIQMPAALMYPAGNPLYDWRYKSDPEPHMHGRRIAQDRKSTRLNSSHVAISY